MPSAVGYTDVPQYRKKKYISAKTGGIKMSTEEKIEMFLQLFNYVCEGVEVLSEIDDDFSEKVVNQIPNTSAILKYNAITLSIIRTQVEKSIAETLKEIAILVKGDE